MTNIEKPVYPKNKFSSYKEAFEYGVEKAQEIDEELLRMCLKELCNASYQTRTSTLIKQIISRLRK